MSARPRPSRLSPPCSPIALARLGPLLCLHRALEPHVLSGWTLARWVRPRICVDAEGPREALCFFAGDGQLCWQLFLLPDSDYLAWDELIASLTAPTPPSRRDRPDGPCPWAIRLIVGEPLWRATALRLHALGDRVRGSELAVSHTALSAAGRHAADCIARCAADA